VETFARSEFDKTAADYIEQLDLDIGPPTAEMRALGTSLSRLRKTAEAERMDALRKDPLRARMRVSDVDPPLTTIEFRGGDRAPEQIALKVGSRETANHAISILLNRVGRMNARRRRAPSTGS
jgi:hypothetical protein